MFDQDGILAWVKTHFVRKRDLAHSLRGQTLYVGALAGAFASYVIASGVITLAPGVTIVTVDTEGAAAADDLVTINGGVDGQIIILRSTVSLTRVVTVKDSTGNMRLAGDMVLDSATDSLTLYQIGGSVWIELARSNNA